jgi:hypothetical protein
MNGKLVEVKGNRNLKPAKWHFKLVKSLVYKI